MRASQAEDADLARTENLFNEFGEMAGGKSGGPPAVLAQETDDPGRPLLIAAWCGRPDSKTKPPRGFYENECFLWFSRTPCVLIRRN